MIGTAASSKRELQSGWRAGYDLGVGTMNQKFRSMLRSLSKRLPEPAREKLEATLPKNVMRERVRWGNLRRVEPFDPQYGFGRGTPIDRVYIEEFLASFQEDIHGDTLEVGDTRYTDRFGRSVTSKQVLDVNPSNPSATIVADLSIPGSLPEDRFDCFILTQTLHLIEDTGVALKQAYASLRTDGVLLLTFPSVSRISPTAGPTKDRWRVTPAGLDRIIQSSCPQAEREVLGRGNLLTGVAFLLGLAAEELKGDELAYDDPRFPLVACARVRKP